MHSFSFFSRSSFKIFFPRCCRFCTPEGILLLINHFYGFFIPLSTSRFFPSPQFLNGPIGGGSNGGSHHHPRLPPPGAPAAATPKPPPLLPSPSSVASSVSSSFSLAAGVAASAPQAAAAAGEKNLGGSDEGGRLSRNSSVYAGKGRGGGRGRGGVLSKSWEDGNMPLAVVGFPPSPSLHLNVFQEEKLFFSSSPFPGSKRFRGRSTPHTGRSEDETLYAPLSFSSLLPHFPPRQTVAWAPAAWPRWAPPWPAAAGTQDRDQGQDLAQGEAPASSCTWGTVADTRLNHPPLQTI